GGASLGRHPRAHPRGRGGVRARACGLAGGGEVAGLDTARPRGAADPPARGAGGDCSSCIASGCGSRGRRNLSISRKALMEVAANLRAHAVVRLWQAILVAGLALLALRYVGHIALLGGSRRLYETWFYEGLELLAALGCLARAVLVRSERSAWFFIAGALLTTTCGDILFDFW